MLCDSFVVTQGNKSAVCAELTCMLQKTRSASVLKRIYDRLAETSVVACLGYTVPLPLLQTAHSTDMHFSALLGGTLCLALFPFCA